MAFRHCWNRRRCAATRRCASGRGALLNWLVLIQFPEGGFAGRARSISSPACRSPSIPARSCCGLAAGPREFGGNGCWRFRWKRASPLAEQIRRMPTDAGESTGRRFARPEQQDAQNPSFVGSVRGRSRWRQPRLVQGRAASGTLGADQAAPRIGRWRVVALSDPSSPLTHRSAMRCADPRSVAVFAERRFSRRGTAPRGRTAGGAAGRTEACPES